MLLMIIKIKMCLCNRLKENKHFCKECLVFANKGKYILYYRVHVRLKNLIILGSLEFMVA